MVSIVVGVACLHPLLSRLALDFLPRGLDDVLQPPNRDLLNAFSLLAIENLAGKQTPEDLSKELLV